MRIGAEKTLRNRPGCVVESPAMTTSSSAVTRPVAPRPVVAQPMSVRGRRRGFPLSAVFFGLVFGLGAALFLLAPIRTNTLILGIDRAPEGTSLSRSDTIILTTIDPSRPYIGMLSIPRDLWVTVPGVGEDRINTAHYYAESTAPGSGPQAAMATVRSNFGVDVHYYVRLRFQSIERMVDALGGLELIVEENTNRYPVGTYQLNGAEALAFVRDRSGDDFFRMQNGQVFVRSLFRQLLRPATWPRIPAALPSLLTGVDTNLPPWEWPRLALAVMRGGPGGIDGRIVSREMVQGFQTAGGAMVLAPRWDQINPVLLEMFGQ